MSKRVYSRPSIRRRLSLAGATAQSVEPAIFKILSITKSNDVN